MKRVATFIVTLFNRDTGNSVPMGVTGQLNHHNLARTLKNLFPGS